MTKDEWIAAYAARVAERSGLPLTSENEVSATDVAIIGAQCAEHDEGLDVSKWDDPANAADEEMSCWDDDGDD